MSQETVFIAKNKKSPYELGFEIMEMVAPRVFGKKILIKPNLTIKASADSGIVTNSVFCEGIIDYLKKNGAEDIKIGEGSSVAPNNEMKEIYQAANYLKLASKTNIELINFNKDGMIELEMPNPIVWKKVKVAKSILDFDLLINVPVLKTHHIALVTLGIKNLMGLFLPISERNKAFHERLIAFRESVKKERRHHLNKDEFKQTHIEISEKIFDLYKAVRTKIPILTVIDGFYGREGNGFEKGRNKDMKIAIAGWNAVAVDAIATYIMGFNPKLIHYLMLAQREKLGPSQLSKIKVKGVNPKEIRTPFKVITEMEEKTN